MEFSETAFGLTVSTKRRKLLTFLATATASSLVAALVNDATTFTADRRQKMLRRVCWLEGTEIIPCLLEGYPDDALQVVDDVHSIWSSRAVFQHLDFADFDSLLKHHTTLGFPHVMVGCAVRDNLSDALESAFDRTDCATNRSRGKGRAFHSVILMLSAPDRERVLETLDHATTWTRPNIPDDAIFSMQLLVDRVLVNNAKRVSVLISP